MREGKEKKISNVYVPSISMRVRLRKRERSILIIVELRQIMSCLLGIEFFDLTSLKPLTSMEEKNEIHKTKSWRERVTCF